MADNYGVLGSTTSTALGTVTAYTCPVGKSAKFKIFAMFQASGVTDVGIIVNGIEVARTGAMAASNYCYTNGGAGILTAPGAAKPTGQGAATTAQPAAPIYYLSAGQTVQLLVAGAVLTSCSMQIVGTEIQLA